MSRWRECPPSKTKRYKGVREPRCFGGDGCWPCWAKFMVKNPSYPKIRQLRDAGICPRCPERRKLPTGYSTCEPCRIKRRAEKIR